MKRQTRELADRPCAADNTERGEDGRDNHRPRKLSTAAIRQAQSAGVSASDSFAEFLREQLAPLGRFTMRRMFGKTGLFCGGVMFGMVTENMLYFRVAAENEAAFERRGPRRRSTTRRRAAPSTPPSGAYRSGCLTSPTNYSHGPAQHLPLPTESQRSAGRSLLSREKARRAMRSTRCANRKAPLIWGLP